jgi:hypothetical protein
MFTTAQTAKPVIILVRNLSLVPPDAPNCRSCGHPAGCDDDCCD